MRQSISYPALLISRSSISSGPTSSVPVFLWVTLQHPIACLHLTTPFHTHVPNGFSSKLHTEGHLVTPACPTPQQTISRVQEWWEKCLDIEPKPTLGANEEKQERCMKLSSTAVTHKCSTISSCCYQQWRSTTSSLHCFICEWAWKQWTVFRLWFHARGMQAASIKQIPLKIMITPHEVDTQK